MTAVESEQAKSAGPDGPADTPAAESAGSAEPTPTPEPAPAAAPAAAAPTVPPAPSADSIVGGLGIGVSLLALLVLGFAGFLYFLSGIQEARSQTTMFATLRGQLEQSLGPLNSPKPGTPVAVLNIPAIGVQNEVVVQGTSPENLTLGPGHLRDTPLPGESGVSVLYGRRATFGGPFSQVPKLKPGDKITVTTGQGTASYRVKLVGDSKGKILINTAPNQLMLVTADSYLVPSHYIEVDANLTSAPVENAATTGVTPAEVALGNDPNALILCMAWGLALVVVSVGGTVAASRWSKWPAFLAVTPIVLAVVWNLYENIAALLPNIY
jgi:sortase A